MKIRQTIQIKSVRGTKAPIISWYYFVWKCSQKIRRSGSSRTFHHQKVYISLEDHSFLISNLSTIRMFLFPITSAELCITLKTQEAFKSNFQPLRFLLACKESWSKPTGFLLLGSGRGKGPEGKAEDNSGTQSCGGELCWRNLEGNTVECCWQLHQAGQNVSSTRWRTFWTLEVKLL